MIILYIFKTRPYKILWDKRYIKILSDLYICVFGHRKELRGTSNETPYGEGSDSASKFVEYWQEVSAASDLCY